jgi:predicted secreted Zn-dependent protease
MPRGSLKWPEEVFPMRRLLLSASSPPVLAEVTENLIFNNYAVMLREGETLSHALTRSSPIREEGEVFRGHTQWNVRWSYRWWEEPNGTCRITANHTTLTAEITLPELAPGSREHTVRRRFETYLQALHAHEIGHYELARTAARKIDAAILALPPMESCASLTLAADRAAEGFLKQTDALSEDYDLRTEHGLTQGATLSE